MKANSIDEVIDLLETIIQQTKNDNDTLGYFAGLYQAVTITVKEKLNTGYFDDDKRMERLDILFANRYLEAFYYYKQGRTCTKSWQKTFELAKNNRLIVLQHLLLGMNAHINLDLGIAASEVSTTLNIDDLEDDFKRINTILASLVFEVQQDLIQIWKPLLYILKLANKADDFLINFSMKIARDGAWKYARHMVGLQGVERETAIKERDDKIAAFADTINFKSWFLRLIFLIIRIGERGSVSSRIQDLKTISKV